MGRPDQEACPCGGPHSWLVPAMLAPPESLLVSCIRRGNFMEAHQVRGDCQSERGHYRTKAIIFIGYCYESVHVDEFDRMIEHLSVFVFAK